jgi:hypothetical protein
MACLKTYDPLNTLKPVADDVWIVDGPIIEESFGPLHFPFTSRMTIVRLPGGELWVHSPTPPADALLAELRGLGDVRFLISPSKLHYWWIGEWKARFPAARTYAAPGLAAFAKRPLPPLDAELGRDLPHEWQDAFDQAVIPTDIHTEIEFYHRASRTAILTDVIQNYETDRITCWHVQWLVAIGGVRDPDGKAPLNMRMLMWRHKREVRAAAERMLAWRPERVILAHGRWYQSDGEAELRRAFRWVL